MLKTQIQALMSAALILIFIQKAGAQAGPQSRYEEALASAQSFEKAGEWKQANLAYQKAAASRNHDEAASIGLAKTYMNLGNKELALGTIRDFLKNGNPFSVEARLAEAEVLHFFKDYESALVSVQSALKIRPGHSAAFEREGYIQFDKGDYNKATDSLTAFLKENANHWTARSRRAQAHLLSGRFDAGIADLKILMEQKPNLLSLHLAMIDAHLKKKDFKSAEVAVRNALSVQSASVEVWNRATEVFVGLGRTSDAIDAYKKIIEFQPDNMEAGQSLVGLYFKTNQAKLVEEELARQLRVKKDFAPAAESLVSLWMSQKKTERAGYFLKRYLDEYPQSTWALKKYSQLLNDIGQIELAREYENKLERAPAANSK